MSKKNNRGARRSLRNSVDVTIHLKSSDGYNSTRHFKTLAGARKFAREAMGQYYDIGSWYAVSGSGTLRMTAEGATLESLLAPDPEPAPSVCECHAGYNEDTGRWSGPCAYCRSPAGLAAKAAAEKKRLADEEKLFGIVALAKKLGNDRFGDGLRIPVPRGGYYRLLRWDDVHPQDRNRIEAAAKRARVDIEHDKYRLALAYDVESIF